MKLKTSFELFRWTYFVLLWLIVMGAGVTLVEVAVGPALQWLFHDVPYHLPTWNRAGRMFVFVVIFSLFIGTLMWFCEKKASGR
jgi:hypothetical protein